MRKTKEQRRTTVGAAASVRPSTKAGQNKGITLIALVITIIVMLILVAVTISMAINGGLFGYAGKAAGDTQNAIDAEQQLGSGKVQIDGVWYDSIDDYLAGKPSSGAGDSGEGGTEGNIQIELSIVGEKGTTVPVPTGFEHVEGTIDTGYVIEDEDGNQFVWVPVEANQKMTLKITSDKDIKSVKLKDPLGDIILTIEDEDIETAYNNTQIEPTVNGMYAVAVETEDETVQETLVVRSLYAIDTWNDWYISEEGVEFVSLKIIAGSTMDKETLYRTIATQEMEYESLEVAMETNGCADIDDFITFFWASMQYKQMEDLADYKYSVNSNKGFYVGRYELGTTTARTNGDSDATVETVISENGIPVTKADVYPYNNITFDQALELAESMYSSTEFTESLLTSAAWDRTLGWIYETSENKEEILKQLAGDSTDWGNYKNASFNITKGKYAEYDNATLGPFTEVTGTYTKSAEKEVLLTTGATTEVAKRNCKNNIFDLAGNVEEYTNTACFTYGGVARGGALRRRWVCVSVSFYRCPWTEFLE